MWVTPRCHLRNDQCRPHPPPQPTGDRPMTDKAWQIRCLTTRFQLHPTRSLIYSWVWLIIYSCLQWVNEHGGLYDALSSITPNLIYILTAVLLGCVASRPVIGWQLCRSNSTLLTGGCCFGRIIARYCWHCYRLHYPRRPASISSASSWQWAKRCGGL